MQYNYFQLTTCRHCIIIIVSIRSNHRMHLMHVGSTNKKSTLARSSTLCPPTAL